MKNRLVILVLFFATLFKAQPPEKFHTRIGGTGIDIGYGVKQCLDKHYIMVGSTTSSGAGNTDIILTKLDTTGFVRWSKTFGGFSNDVGKAVIQLVDSGYIISGYTNSFGNGGYDAVLIRTDKLGNQIWLQTYGGLDWDFAHDIIETSDGNVVICGSTSSYGKGKTDGFVAKYTVSGILMWQKFFGGVEEDEFKGLYTKNGSEIYVAGTTKSYGEINGDMYVFKLNTSGDSLMRIIYGGSLEDNCNDVTIDRFDNLFIAGGSNSFSNGKKDGLIVKFTTSGTYLNKTNLGSVTKDEEIFKIIPTTSEFGEIVVIYSEDQNLGTGKDYLTLALNNGLFYMPGGNNGSFGYAADEEPYDICSTKDKGYAQVGYTKSLNAIDKDILFVKRDSMIRYGTLYVGIKESSKSLQKTRLKAYPNPISSNELLTLFIQTNETNSITITDISGKTIKTEIIESSNGELKLNLDYLSKGLYFLNINNNKENFYIKILKL